MNRFALMFVPLALVLISCTSYSPRTDEPRAMQVPMKLVNRTPVIIVKIGDRDIPLQLDLGSGTTLTLFPEVFEQIDADPTGETRVSMGMEGIAMNNPEYTVPTVTLGDAIFRELVVRKDDHSEQHRVETIEHRGTYGRVGRGLFDTGRLIVDYERERLTIVPSGAPDVDQAACSGIEIPLETDKKELGITTRVQTDIGELFAVWDTGARGNIMLKKTTDAAGLSLVARDKFHTEAFEMNGHDFGPVRMNVWDIPIFPPDLHTLLGYWFFADKVVCVDFPQDRLFVQISAGNQQPIE